MSKRYYIEQMFCGIGLIMVSLLGTVFSVKYCDGDCTAMLLIFPIGIGTLFSNAKFLNKKESKNKI